MPKVRKDPYPALGRMDPLAVASSSCILGGRWHLVVPFVAAVERLGVDSRVGGVAIRTVQGTGLDQRFRMDLGHQPYRFGHRTPALYSRNQSRTNIALLKEMERRGRVSLPSCSI